MSITLEDGETASVIRVDGDLDIACSSELRDVLIEAILSRKKVHLDLERATDLDVTAVQLLWSATREAEKAGTSFTVAQVPGCIGSAVQEMGFENLPASLNSTAAADAASASSAGDGDDR